MEEIKNSGLVVITGGARSGKSGFAEKLAQESGLAAIFLATAHAGDPEMEKRIERHRRERPASFTTRETPLDPCPVLESEGSSGRIMLLDCFTVLLSNRLLREADICAGNGNGGNPESAESEENALENALLLEEAAERTREYVEQLARAFIDSPSPVLLVTNEVGMSLVPDNPLGRVFRDLAGRANQLMASRAGQVWFLVSGIPWRLK